MGDKPFEQVSRSWKGNVLEIGLVQSRFEATPKIKSCLEILLDLLETVPLMVVNVK